jgi:hypothetical protein
VGFTFGAFTVGPALAAGVSRDGPTHFSELERLTGRRLVVWGLARLCVMTMTMNRQMSTPPLIF